MADITLCTNEKCPNRQNCLRAILESGFRQSWAYFEFEADDEGNFVHCVHAIWAW